MNLESQVTSLELSKKLKELGVKQESLFYWERCSHFGVNNNFSIIYEPTHDLITYEFGDCHCIHSSHEYTYSAFTASELLELLPLFSGSIPNIIKTEKYTSSYFNQEIKFNDENLSNSLAKMLIHLTENKLIEV